MMEDFVSSTAKDYIFNKGAQWIARSPYAKAAAKAKLLGSYAETQREYWDYIVDPQLKKQFGISSSRKLSKMPYTMSTAYKNRYKGTKYSRRLAAKRALDFSAISPVPKKAKTSTNPNLGIGEPVGTSNCKTNIVNATTATRNTNTLHNPYASFLNIAQGTGINNRSRRVINLRGVRVQVHYKLVPSVLTDQGNDLVYLNYAVISAKDGVSTVSTTDFFRGYGSNRSIDFPGTNADIPILINNPINTDKYQVLVHKRVRLAYFSNNQGTPEYVGDHYIPIKRQIRYDSDAATSHNGRLDFVMWCTTWDSDNASAIKAVVNERVDLYTYFRDPDV